MCAWVRIPLLSNFAFKKPTFWSKQEFWESNEKQDKRIPHYKKVLSKTGWSKCDILKAGWPSGLRRQTQESLLWDFWYTNVCVGSNPTPVKFCVQNGNILIEAVSNPTSCRILRSKSQHFGRNSISESQIKSKRKQISHYKKVLSKTGWSMCDILKAGWPSGLRRQTQEILLWGFWYTNVCLGSNLTPVKFCVQKANILVKAGVLRVKWEARQTDSTLQEGVIEDRMKQVRYTQGRMAERSKAPDSRKSPLRLLVHECVRGFDSHSCQILRSKRQHFKRNSIESHSRQILRSKSQHFGRSSISESQIKSKTKQISHYKKVLSKTGWSKCDILKAGWPSGLRRQTQEILLWGFWYTNVCLGSNLTPVKFCVQKANILVKAGVLRVKWEARQTDSTLQEGVIEDRMKQVRYTQGRMAERSKAPDSRKSPLRLLVHECVRGFESHSCQILRSKWQHFNRSSIESHSCRILRSKSQHFGRNSISKSQIKSKTKQISHYKKCMYMYTNVCLGSNLTPVKFCVQKANILVKAGVLRVKWEARQTDSTLQEGVIEDRMKQVRYTQGRMAERSKAPDSRKSPLRLLVHECVRGFDSHSCQILRSKRQHFKRNSIESHSRQILRSKSQHFGRSSISESQIKSKTKQISHYKKVLSKTGWSKCDILKAGWPSGLRRQTQEILLWGFWYTNVCLGSNLTPVKFCVQKANILVKAGVLRVKWEARQTDSTLQEGVIEDRMKQVRYTQGRMAERSKAPDSRKSPLRLLVHECVRGFDSHSCQILRSKRQHFKRNSIESHSRQILRSKSQHFGRSSISESQIKSKTKQISHYKKVLSKTGWSKCDILKAGWPSGLRRQTQEILLWGFWYTNVCLGSNLTPVKFCVQKANILVKAGVLRVKWEARQTDSTLQEGVIEDRMKQVRYTQGRMAERSKAPDSRKSPLRLLVHECVRGFESPSCQILRSKWQHFNRSSIESHSCRILRSKSQHFGRNSISKSQIKSKTKQISHYKKVLSKTGWSKCDILKAGWPSGLRRQTQEILLWGFWYTNVCLGSNPTPVKFCVQKANILVEAGVLRVKWEARQTDSTLQEGVIEDRMKQVRYTQGRMAERSKAPDSRKSPLRLLVHECVRGFESHSCQILRSKWQHFNRSSIESHSCRILRSKSQHFGRNSISESQIKSNTKQISHYKKVLSKTGWSKCDILKAGWPSGLRRQTQEILLWGFWYTNVCLGSNLTPVKFCVQKANILVKAGVLRVKWEARQTDSTLQEGVIEDRMKQVRYTQGRLGERSKAPDSRKSPLRLLVHECVRGFESHSCQILRSKWQHFNRSSIESHSCRILRSKSQHFGRNSIS